MANAHPFNFEGGEELSHMGATWFVSFAYYTYVDRNHKEWENVKTASTRRSLFNRTQRYHEFWLNQVLLMENSRLNTNTLGLHGLETKAMAMEVLARL